MSEVVKSFGPINAKIAIVGEAPGAVEVALGRPFCGPSGGLTRVLLADAGIDMDKCRLLNVIETRPEKDFKTSYYIKGQPTAEFYVGADRLKQELKQLPDVNLIIMLGKEALYALTGNTSIDSYRGTIHQTPCGKAIGTYHPARILRDYSLRPVAQIDINRCAQEFLFPEANLPKFTMRVNPSFDEVMDFLITIPPTFVSFDIESIGRQVRCLGFSTDGQTAICIPFFRVNRIQTKQSGALVSPQSDNTHFWSFEEEKAIISATQEYFKEHQFIGQNFPYDVTMLESAYGLVFPNLYLDTMAAHHVAYPELPKSLDFLASVYTRIPHYSNYDPKSDLSTWTYNGLDCIATFQVAEKIIAELKAKNLLEFYFSHVNPLIKALTTAQNTGVLIDVENRSKLAQPFYDEMQELLLKQQKRFAKTVNLGSPKQVLETLQSIGITPRNRYGKLSTDVKVLTPLSKRYPAEAFITDVLTYRKKQKFLKTYVEAQLDPDNRFRTSYDGSGTVTGRISSSKTIWGTGGNLQNIPVKSDDPRIAEFRRLFIAPPGWKIFHADLSQAEARAVAWLSRDEELIDRFLNDPDFDIHKTTAARIYNISEADVSPTQRQQAKQCVHSGNYGIKAQTFSIVSHMPFAKAKFALEKYQSRPSLQRWWTEVRDKLKLNRTLETPFGRKREFYGRLDHDTFRQAYGYVPQSTVGDIINQAFYVNDLCLNQSKARLILQVHDELDIEVRDDYIDECKIIVKNSLNIPLDFKNGTPELLIPVDYGIGQNWYDLNPL